ncbi:hypothetical protein [Microbacterium sp. SLBN-146]|uniref:hypothetical protein n=1 Tax=Microbacterium sp. SLBN-146 TaxID=2768457 RepID=UPI0021B313BB|nr:hypothetical protein [Microbacterium sp. SLBN-146]
MRSAGSNSGGDDAEPVEAGPYCGHVLENRDEVIIVYLFDDMDELIGLNIQCSHGV